ncbi:MAG: SGNH hydrolase domain-containing protein, partial [Alphaproteobacteria bacterium]
SLWVMGALVPVAFVCGYLSWRYVEKPFRDSRRISQAQIFKFSGVSLAGLVIAGVLFQLDDGLRFRFSPADNKVMTESQYSPFAEKCEASASRTVTPEEACTYFGDHKHYAVLGDSHVTALAYIFAETLKPQNEGLYHFAHSWGVPGFTMPEYERRHKWSVDALAFLQEQDDVHTVILAYRHSYYLNGENNGFYPHLPDESPLPKLGGGQEEVQERYWGSFSYAVEQLLAAGKRVVVLLPVPELGRPLEDAVYNSAWRGQKKAGIPYAYYRERNEKFYTLLDQAPWRDKVVLVDPTKQLCDDDNCYIVEDGQSLYGDDDHLSLFGARFLVDELMRKLGETQK